MNNHAAVIKAVCFGEALFDVFEEDRIAGGAPLNLAVRLSDLGIPAALFSTVGADKNGKDLKRFLKERKVSIENITTVSDYPTGIVEAFINKKGSATYEIKTPAAWDYISLKKDFREKLEKVSIFFYGSLAARNKVSRKSLLTLLKSNSKMYKVLDINLRPPHYQMDVLLDLMLQADFIKFNEEEITEITLKLGHSASTIEDKMKFILNKTKAQALCVTQGSEGSILYWENQFYAHPGFKVEVVDTVGAGDAFLAALISQLAQSKPPPEALTFASAVGALVTQQRGANPKIKKEEIEALQNRK